jgi:hypothetical protein
MIVHIFRPKSFGQLIILVILIYLFDCSATCPRMKLGVVMCLILQQGKECLGWNVTLIIPTVN